MKPIRMIPLISIALLALSTTGVHAAEPGAAQAPKNITTQVTIVALPNDEALAFNSKQDLHGKAATALHSLEQLVGQKKAHSVANLAVTAGNGINAVSNSGKVSLNCTAVVSPDGVNAKITLVLDNHGQNLMSSVGVKNGAVIFLGSMQSPADKTMTEYIFARVFTLPQT